MRRTKKWRERARWPPASPLFPPVTYRGKLMQRVFISLCCEPSEEGTAWTPFSHVRVIKLLYDHWSLRSSERAQRGNNTVWKWPWRIRHDRRALTLLRCTDVWCTMERGDFIDIMNFSWSRSSPMEGFTVRCKNSAFCGEALATKGRRLLKNYRPDGHWRSLYAITHSISSPYSVKHEILTFKAQWISSKDIDTVPLNNWLEIIMQQCERRMKTSDNQIDFTAPSWTSV